jgi:hypothetical protein
MGTLVLGLIVVGGIVYLRSRTAPIEKPAEPSAAPAPARRTEPPPPPPAAGPDPAVEAAPRKAAPKKPARAPAPAVAPAAPTLASLTLSSDVAGASVFINREYVGTTPLTLDRLEPGTRQFKLSAEGFEGIERSVDLVAGDNPVTLRFKEVRLNKRIAVTHKHGTGSCEGTLVATLDGLSYETSNKNDAFTLAWDKVETMAVDYLDKNLKVKQRGAKTWNFTDKRAANADALFVFQRDVESARKKLASGYTAVR